MIEEYNEFMEKGKTIREYVREHAIDFRVYEGRYFAVTKINEDFSVVGSDENKAKLATRISKRFPNHCILIASLEEILNPREIEMPSPEGVNS